MTANAEATGAREALMRFVGVMAERGGMYEAAALRWIDGHYPAPAPRKVRAGAGISFSDDDSQRCKAVASDDRPVGGTPVLPSCECGHSEARHRTLVTDGCRDCPCTEYEARTPAPSPTLKHRYVDRPPLVIDEGDTPSASPEAGQSPSCAAQDTADRPKVWITLDAATVEQLRQSGMLTYTSGESELARVQRERDETKWRERSLYDDTMRCIPADWKPDYARDWGHVGNILAEYVDDLRAERDVALDRARVAEQRIETGVECWHYETDGRHSLFFRSNPADRESQNIPFTRGRFVADTGET